MNERLRGLPSVDLLMREIDGAEQIGPLVARWLCRTVLDQAREQILAGADPPDVRAAVGARIADLLGRKLRRVINATGVALHTNLGRAPLSPEALDAVAAAGAATPVEYDLATGRRAERAPVAAVLAAALCEAEAALVVNNNAGALLLTLAALAKDREVIVGRGELIEIGGEFRLPELMESSGARLREVGTTNRTRAADYERAVSPDTALVLKVHPSNYEIVGFTASPSVAELAPVARAAGVPLVFDIGSGLLRPAEGPFADEPDAQTALASGADLICFSGDKLLAGPQAGILAGRADLIAALRRHAIARAVRADKLSLAALEATLWLHAHGKPTSVQAMLDVDVEQVRARATALAARLQDARVIDGESVAGGGSTPGRAIPTALLALPGVDARRLRENDPPIVARVERDLLVIDLRTVAPADDEAILRAVVALR